MKHAYHTLFHHHKKDILLWNKSVIHSEYGWHCIRFTYIIYFQMLYKCVSLADLGFPSPDIYAWRIFVIIIIINTLFYFVLCFLEILSNCSFSYCNYYYSWTYYRIKTIMAQIIINYFELCWDQNLC